MFLSCGKNTSGSLRTKNAVGTQAIKQEFAQLFQVLTNFHESYYNFIET